MSRNFMEIMDDISNAITFRNTYEIESEEYLECEKDLQELYAELDSFDGEDRRKGDRRRPAKEGVWN